MREEEILHGISLSEGVAIGTPFFLSNQEEETPEFEITISEVDEEIARYRNALFSSKEDLELIQCTLEGEGSEDAVTIIDTHIQMLKDPMMTVTVEEKIRQMKQNTEAVFKSVITDYENRFFSATKDLFFQERMADVNDLSKRILRHLGKKPKKAVIDIPHNSILVARVLTPSDVISLPVECAIGFITEKGGENSHAALIARGRGIPFVSGIDISKILVSPLILNGIKGKVILNPTSKTLAASKKIRTALKKQEIIVLEKAETIDGHKIKVFANVGNLNDLDLIHESGAEGIGLFRTEYLFSHHVSLFASEEEQYEIYCKIIQSMKGLPVVFRVFDVGADKYVEFFKEPLEGLRGIRFLLTRREIFITQLSALTRATEHGDVRILLPFISDIHELLESKKILSEISNKKIPLGCMIELPSAVLTSDFLSKECDFLSIGTNDLIQYSLGLDRASSYTDELFQPIHPSILRMVNIVAGLQKPVTICGEIASNPLLIPLLIGLGIKEFSASPRFIPAIKKVIQNTKFSDAQILAQKALMLPTAREIARLIEE